VLAFIHIQVIRFQWAATIAAPILIALLLMHSVAAEAQNTQLETTTYDGLELIKSKKVDVLYRLPGASLTSYNKILLDPVQVAFKKKWTPDPMRVNANDRERIRKDIAEEFHKVFTKELQERGGYTFVETAGPDVLRVSTGLVNIYITAPDTVQAGRSRTYTTSAGEMTLVAELRDSESGAVLARAADRESANSTLGMQWTSRLTNEADARQIILGWAKILRKALDAARSPES
jgi:hypothetical protein